MKSNIFPLTRRTFLGGVGALLLSRCSDDTRLTALTGGAGGKDGGGDTGTGTDTGVDAGGIQTPFDAWRALRDATDASPDNYPAQAKKLIAGKDAEAIFRFVRDNIRTIPSPNYAVSGLRWGLRGALRGGAGTPRERADLLAWMYQQAGFEAEVVQGFPADELAAPDALTKVYARTIVRNFEPGPPPAPYATWTDALGPSTLVPKVVDAGGSESGPLADALAALLPSTAEAIPTDVSPNQQPAVKVTVNGEVKYANPLLPDAVFGKPYVSNPGTVDPADPPLHVKATLSIARSDAPNTHIDLATTSFGLDELVGRQLLVRFSPPEPVDMLLGMTLEQIQLFAPVLALSAIDLTKDETDKKAVVGTMFTTSGDLIDTTGGEVKINGVALDQSNVDPGAAAKVASVKMEIGAQTFPMIELLVSALDSNGKPVAGLAASAFTVSEDDAPMQLFMRQNGGDLRVLFLIDETTSQPPAFLDATQRAALGQSLGQALFAAFPNAKAQTQALDTELASPDGFTATNAAALAAQFQAVSVGNGSPFYQDLAHATKAGPSVIVLFTDGVVLEDPVKVKAYEAVIATGAPVLVVGCKQGGFVVDQAAIDSVAALTGGAAINVGDMPDLAPVNAAIAAIVQKRAAAPYRFAYRAPLAGNTTRNVALGVTSGPKTTGTYSVPAQPHQAASVCGIHLKLELGVAGFEAPYLRTLAGWAGPGLPQQGLAQSVLDEVRKALFGTVVVSFEGGAPSLSTWLSDLISAALLGEPIFYATQTGDMKQFTDALAKGQSVTIPTDLAAVHTPLAFPAGTSVFESNPRVVLVQLQPNSKKNRRMDILPFTRFATYGVVDKAEAFRTALKSSMRLAVMEKALYQTSTASALSGKTLKLLPPASVDITALSAFPPDRQAAFDEVLAQYRYYHRAIAADGSTEAFWAIDMETGSVLGVLPDGSGGGSSGNCKDYNDAAKYFELLELLNEILGLPGVSYWLVLGKFVAIAAIEAAMCFTGGPPAGAGNLDALGCAFAEAALGDAIGKGVGDFGNKALDFLKNYGADKTAGKISNGAGCPPLTPKC